MNGQIRADIKIGVRVKIVLNADRRMKLLLTL